MIQCSFDAYDTISILFQQVDTDVLEMRVDAWGVLMLPFSYLIVYKAGADSKVDCANSQLYIWKTIQLSHIISLFKILQLIS